MLVMLLGVVLDCWLLVGLGELEEVETLWVLVGAQAVQLQGELGAGSCFDRCVVGLLAAVG